MVLVTYLSFLFFTLLAEAAQNGSLCESSFQQAAVQHGSHLLGLDGLDDLDDCLSAFHFPLLQEAVRYGALWELAGLAVFASDEGFSPLMG
jgi:hypothetical protein